MFFEIVVIPLAAVRCPRAHTRSAGIIIRVCVSNLSLPPSYSTFLFHFLNPDVSAAKAPRGSHAEPPVRALRRKRERRGHHPRLRG